MLYVTAIFRLFEILTYSLSFQGVLNYIYHNTTYMSHCWIRSSSLVLHFGPMRLKEIIIIESCELFLTLTLMKLVKDHQKHHGKYQTKRI